MHPTELFTKEVPEKLGIPSRAILNFVKRIEEEQIHMHGFIIVRKGRIAAEGYFKPYKKEDLHRMYSVSKSFVALAIGLLIDEGKITLQDKIVQFFEDKLTKSVHPYIAQATVRDLLMMASPHAGTTYTVEDKDWAKTFFHKEPTHLPGTIFSYDTSATVILNTIVERITRKPFLEYMREKVLDPIGFSKDAWCIQTPEGTSWGGSGVLCTLRDLAKLAYVCLKKGKWGDKQLISEEYIQEATTKQIDNSLMDEEGYGYQIWMEKHNGFSFRGMGSQFAFCYPEEDVIFACISDTQMMGDLATSFIRDAFYEEIFAKLTKDPFPVNPEAQEELDQVISRLTISPVKGEPKSSFVSRIHGRWFMLSHNSMKIKRMRFFFEENEGVWEYENESGLHKLHFGIGRQIKQVFPETRDFHERIGTPSGKGYQCLLSGAWVEDHKLNIQVLITDAYLGSIRMSVAFKGDELSIHMKKAAEWFLNEYEGFAAGKIIND